MSASNKIGDRLIAAAQVAGVVATGWFVWINHVLPRLSRQSLAAVAAQALLYVTLAWICGAVVTFWVYMVASLADLARVARFTIRTSAAAMWFAPAIVLLSAPFGAAIAVSLFLVASATMQLFAQWAAIESPVHSMEPARSETALLFRVAGPEAAFLAWTSAPVLMGSLTAQAGLVAILWHDRFLAAGLFVLSTAILTSLSIATGAYRPGNPPALPHSALSVVLIFLLAVALTFGGISARGAKGAGSEAGEQSGASGPQSATRLPAPPADESTGFGGDFPGVILLPPLKPHTMLVAPAPAAPGRFGALLSRPVGIPFDGEYWMFRWPAKRPPLGAEIRRGSASELSFHTTDGWPMEMEAHQKLDIPVDVKCCSQIQIAIQNTDQYPGTVAIELLLIDTQSSNLSQSLGAVPAGYSPSAGQVLTFSIPPTTTLRRFDEIKAVFRRDRIRADKSAKIEIERFVLVP